MKHPNILVICSDQHHPGAAGCLGHPVISTPNLDRLAAGGALFSRCYCSNPICTPSRMSFITGQYCHRIHVPDNGFPLDPGVMTWARDLAQRGYQTVMLGKMDFCGEYQDGGFTDYRIIRRRRVKQGLAVENGIPVMTRPSPTRLRDAFRAWGTVLEHLVHAGPRTAEVLPEAAEFGERDYRIGNYDHDKLVTRWAVEFLRNKGAQKAAGEAPWLLYAGLVYPHAPYTVPTSYFDAYYPWKGEMPCDYRTPNPRLHPAMRHLQRALGVGNPPEEALHRTLAAYAGMVSCLDDMIGEILKELVKQGLDRDTYVLYLSDHGDAMGEHGLFFKKSPYEGAVRVPCILKGPGIQPGIQVDSPVSLVDMYPTLMELAGHPGTPGLPGESWVPLVRGEKRERKAPVFAEYHGLLNYYDWFMMIEGEYKYTWYDRQRPSLFHLGDDPCEMDDLALDSGYQGKLRHCEEILRALADPEAVCLEAKRQLGLVGPDGEDRQGPPPEA